MAGTGRRNKKTGYSELFNIFVDIVNKSYIIPIIDYIF